MKTFAENFPIGPPPDIAKEARPCIVPEDLDLSIVAGIDDGILSERYCRDDGILRFHGVAGSFQCRKRTVFFISGKSDGKGGFFRYPVC